jgi:predicted helicase
MTMTAELVRPTHKAIKDYYDALRRYARQEVSYESALRPAFLNLLTETAKAHGWDVIAELPYRSAKLKGKRVHPDATVRDGWRFDRGYWEAKDAADKLEVEIRRKLAAGYPASNIIFEDTITGVLYQNGQESFRARLDDKQQLADLLNLFFGYSQPLITNFDDAVAEFGTRVPDLAKGVLDRIHAAREEGNEEFIESFERFFEICRTTLNPSICREAVEEMLVQHLLTERLFDNVFRNQEFTRRNVIAVEIEKVINSLVSQSFNRQEYLKSLDRFYVAIEAAAKQQDDFTEKQRFLNNVYERFFQGFSVKFADTYGIVYTPQELVDFMCSSVEHVLKREFGYELSSDQVKVIDPCTGTGNFVVNILRRIDQRKLIDLYKKRLFANEVMLLPYYIASQNIEHEYYDITQSYASFEGLCFVDTLDLADENQGTFASMSQKNSDRINRQWGSEITVIIGNPPYNMGQVNENDNNKNRKYEIVDRRIRNTFAKDSTARLKNKLYDAYVKFWRWSIDRLRGKDGIVCLVTNNSFVEDITFDGMRKHLREEFSHIYHLDLGINIRKNPQLSGSTHNVFGITPSVGITVAVRSKRHRRKKLFYCRVPYEWPKGTKLRWIEQTGSIAKVDWELREPCARNNWLPEEQREEFAAFLPARDAAGPSIFNLSSLGIGTNREEWVYALTTDSLEQKVRSLIKNYNSEVSRLQDEETPPTDLGQWINNDPAFAKWTDRLAKALVAGKKLRYEATKVRRAMFRPFVEMNVYFDSLLVHRRYQEHKIFPTEAAERENRVIIVSQKGYRARTYNVFMTAMIPDLHVCASADGHQCFPFYVYGEDGANRNENISDWALERFRAKYGQKVTKWDIFYYIYGIINHSIYVDRYAENLKKDLPRIPLQPDFKAYCEAGKLLGDLHVLYKDASDYPLRSVVAQGARLSYKIEKMKLSRDKRQLRINETLTLEGIPDEAYAYRLGGKSPLEWMIDQYRITTDTKSGITFDPNVRGSAEYVVDLIPKIVQVSVESARIIAGLPEWVSE